MGRKLAKGANFLPQGPNCSLILIPSKKVIAQTIYVPFDLFVFQ